MRYITENGGGWVAPLAGAWIEIGSGCHAVTSAEVAPLAGAWIEIRTYEDEKRWFSVAPLAGAWIEILKTVHVVISKMSLLSQERGLKLYSH